MKYFHTQYAPIGTIMVMVIVFQIVLGALFWTYRPVVIVLVVVGVTVLLVTAAFGQQTVSDEGDHLAIGYSPLSLFRKRISYDAITSVGPESSSIIDDWGIHTIPWRGWIYNLCCFDCVRLRVNGRVVRIRSDDVAGLVEFLRNRIGNPARSIQQWEDDGGHVDDAARES